MSTAAKPKGRAKGQAKPKAIEPSDPNEVAIDTPNEIAQAILLRHYVHPDGLRLKSYNGNLYEWKGSHYRAIPTNEIKKKFNKIINEMFVDKYMKDLTNYNIAKGIDPETKARPPKKRDVNGSLIDDVCTAMGGEVQVPVHDNPILPVWSDGTPSAAAAAAEWIPFQNTIVNLPNLIEERVVKRDPTPNFFNVNVHDFDFVADPAEPVAWLAFLQSVWPNDPMSIACLQEWMGYLFTPLAREQKMLMLKGPTRSGKGTINWVVQQLLGVANVAFTDFGSISGPFGLSNIAGKQVAIFPEAKVSDKTDVVTAITRLLSISGEDPQTVNRKNRDEQTEVVFAKVMICLNEIAVMRDISEAFANRFIILTMTRSFLGKEDHGLKDQFKPELPAIFRWAVRGLARLRSRGRFLEPESSAETRVELETSNCKLAGFVHRRCGFDEKRWVTPGEMHEAYEDDCLEQRIDQKHVIGLENFGRIIKQFYASKITRSHKVIDGHDVAIYRGVYLLPRDDAPHYGPCWPFVRMYLDLKDRPVLRDDVVSYLEGQGWCREDVELAGEVAGKHVDVTRTPDGRILWALTARSFDELPISGQKGAVAVA